MAIDSYYEKGIVSFDEDDIIELKKIFNRDYTKGFLFNTENNDLINGYRPNHMGMPIGEVTQYKNGYVKISLSDNVSIGSGLRVIDNDSDVGIILNNFYIDKNLVKKASAGDVISLKINSPVRVGSKVLITLDSELNNDINMLIDSNLRKVNIYGKFVAKGGQKINLTFNDGVNLVTVYGNICQKAINNPTTKNTIYEKLNKLGDTVYKFKELEINIDSNIFIPLKEINDLRRDAVTLLNKKRLYEYEFVKGVYDIDVPDFKKEQLITCLVPGKKEFEKLERDYDLVYSEEEIDGTILKLPRVVMGYPEYDKEVMIGELGGFNKYKNVYTDFSLNVVNSYTVAFLHSLGAKRITLSYELNDSQIKNLIKCYHDRYGKHPNLELIVSGYEEVMISKFSLNKYYNNDKIYLRDVFGNKFRVRTKNGYMYIYNYKKRDNYSDSYYEMGVNSLRINLD